MTVKEFVEQVNKALGAPEVQALRIAEVRSFGQDFGEGSELCAMFFYLVRESGVRPDRDATVCIADERCEE